MERDYEECVGWMEWSGDGVRKGVGFITADQLARNTESYCSRPPVLILVAQYPFSAM
jgi:hypothetical protein